MKNYKKAKPYCDEALTYNEHSLHGLLSVANAHMEAENFEAAISSLNNAKEHHPGAQQVNQLLQNAQVELKRSKTKDYYKALGLARDADELQIKSAYRKMVKLHHPDKAHKQGINKEEAEKMMAALNEAYEVLSDPELKARYDQGDDPNDHESQRRNPVSSVPSISTIMMRLTLFSSSTAAHSGPEAVLSVEATPLAAKAASSNSSSPAEASPSVETVEVDLVVLNLIAQLMLTALQRNRSPLHYIAKSSCSASGFINNDCIPTTATES